MLKKLFLVFLLCILVGCGKTNLLQWAKAPEKTSNLEMARKYIDEGEYTKAKSYVQNSTSKEGKILYAQCLMGEAGVDLSTIISALSDENITDNPVIRLEKLVNDSADRSKILEASDIFIQNQPSKTSDIIIATLCTMIGHVAFVKDNFDPSNIGLLDVATSHNNGTTPISDGVNTYNVAIGDNVYDQYIAMGNPLYYIGQSAQLLSNIKGIDQSIKDAIVSFNAAADIVSENFNTTVTINVNGVDVPVNFGSYHIFPWQFAKPLFLM